jgi:hypothetical protein
MKKPYLALSILTLSLAVVACGKSDNSQVVAGSGVTTVVPTAPVPTPPPTPGLTLQQYCQMSGFVYVNASLCTRTDTYYGQQYNFNIGSTGALAFVYSGQRVQVSSSGNPAVYVGANSIGSGNISVVSPYSGALTFQKYSFSTFSISSVTITTCISAPGQAATCP